MRVTAARVVVVLALSASAAPGLRALAAEGPLVELELTLRELESAVRAVHHERLDAQRESEAGRTNAARLEADALDLSREAVALEDEARSLGAPVAALEKERDEARARKAKLDRDRTTLEKDGTVRLGASGTLGATSPAARALADQISRRVPPVFVRAPVDLGEGAAR